MPAAAGQGPPPRLSDRPRRTARAVVLILIVPLAAYVLYALLRAGGRDTGPPPGGESAAAAPSSEMREFRFEQTREGRLRYLLRAERFLGTESGVNLLEGIRAFEIHGPDGPIRMSADRGRVVMSGEEVSQVALEGSVEGSGPAGERLEASAALFRAPERSVDLSGPVRFASGSVSGEAAALLYNLDTGRVEATGPVTLRSGAGPLEGWELSAARLTGSAPDGPARLTGGVVCSRGAERIRADALALSTLSSFEEAHFAGHVEGLLAPEPPGAGREGISPEAAAAAPVSIRSDAMRVTRAGPDAPFDALLTGRAAVRSSGPDGPAEIAAPEILIRLSAAGEPMSLLARRNGTLKRMQPEAAETLSAEEISLRLSGGRIAGGEASGGVRIEREGGEARGSRAELKGDSLALTGERPSARDGRRFVVADLLESDRRGGGLSASGRVRVRIDPAEDDGPDGAQASLPGLRAGEPVHVESARAEFPPEGAGARFRGGVRAWQGEGSLQSEELDILESPRRAHARGRVTLRGIREESGEGAQGAAGPPVRTPYRITADEMLHDPDARTTRFLGGAVYSERARTLRAREIVVHRGSPEDPRETLEAEGDVLFTAPGQSGRGDRAVYHGTGRTITLIGGARPATVEDLTNRRSLAAPALTVDLRDNSVAMPAESGERGRIRIGKPPRRAGAGR